MSMIKHELQYSLDHIIALLEGLPGRFLDEMEKRKEIKKQFRYQELKDELELMHNNKVELNKMMFGYEPPHYK